MSGSETHQSDVEEAAPLTTSTRVLPQLLVLVALVAIVLGVVGGAIWAGGAAVSQFLPASTPPMTMQELEDHTGYDFPEGSEIVSAHSGQRALDRAGSWALLAKVRLPPPVQSFPCLQIQKARSRC